MNDDTRLDAATLYGVGEYRLNRKAAALRNKLLRLGCIPVATADFSNIGGVVAEFWGTSTRQTIRFCVERDGSASI